MARTKKKVEVEYNPNSMSAVVSNLIGQFKVWQDESVKFREMMEGAQKGLRGEVEKLGDRIEGLLKVEVQSNGGVKRVYDMRDLLLEHETELRKTRSFRSVLGVAAKNQKIALGVAVFVLLGAYFAGTLGLLPLLMKFTKLF